ncbi:glycosyltransferase, group 1 family protein [Aeromicrobium marinum DSM 15272]|uniref:Glycosyltransferase, group 1 family protein n=1 Tax=Aeromicrobium marinum DSM 15272 TaxID=585531 RepID=E2SG29_9ACTN|nr:glycosyltransferase family 1 protein [Aeromicrobium marinum]EFQ81786.1 glycosyltransferase, group 1 family protein [Aeromicrobium marinum DSM 15272]
MATILVDLLSLTGSKGGMEVYTRELYQQFAVQAPQHEFVGFASTEAAAMDLTWFPGRIVDSGISGENRLQWARGELLAVNPAARRAGADLIHSPATLGPHRRDIPTVVTMHDMLYWSHPEFMSTPLYTAPVKLMERIVSRRADRVVTISEASAEAIGRYLSVPRSRISVIHLAGRAIAGVDRDRHRPDQPLLLGTGNRRPHKNWETLVRALALIDPPQRPRLALTGSGPDDPMIALVAELELQPWVELHGWIEESELADLYSRATLLATPSFCEGFSLTPVEGMLSGIPVLISDIAVHREVAGDAAVYVDPSDPAAMAATIARVVSDPALLAEHARKGLDQASRYSWEDTARRTLAVFDEVLTASGR